MVLVNNIYETLTQLEVKTTENKTNKKKQKKSPIGKRERDEINLKDDYYLQQQKRKKRQD